MLSRLSSIRFNPRTPCGVRLVNGNGNNGQDVFQSTHSLRSATRYARSYPSYLSVSIHALLAECDRYAKQQTKLKICFNPRTPCGVRRGVTHDTDATGWFQSTHSLRSATHCGSTVLVLAEVSIHALLAECDWIALPLEDYQNGFNPRTPCGVRPLSRREELILSSFQSTHSLRSATDH